MNSAALFAAVAVGLFCIGLHALIFHAHLLRKILALNVMGSAVFLVLVSASMPAPGAPPDPVSQALVITGIVVAVSTTAFALVLMLKLSTYGKRADLDGAQDDS